MAPAVDHCLITRFNLPSPGHESSIRTRPGWLEGRIELFERYCAPNVREQRDGAIRWLIYFDPESPGWFKSWVDKVADGLFVPVYRDVVEHDDLLDDLDALVPRKSQVLLTTNLDNDDGLGRDFVARHRNHETQLPRVALYYARGLVKSPTGLYLRTDRSNAFASVRESWDEPLTAWWDWHNLLHVSMPVEVLNGSPQWLQVVHDNNVSNRTRGRLVSPAAFADDFVGIEDVPEPSNREIWSDRLVFAPLRAVRDGSRVAARRAAIAALGKEGASAVRARVSDALKRP